MTVSVASQVSEFLACALSGGICAVLFELTEYLHVVGKRRKLTDLLLDVLFSIAALATVVFTLLRYAFGNPLPYHFLALLIGFCAVNRFFCSFARKHIVKAGKYFARLCIRFKNGKLGKKIFK